MSQSAEKYYTPEEYFALEEKSDRKSEYYNGKIYLMSGGSANHSRIAVNVIRELSVGLGKSECEVFNSDMRILSLKDDFYTYADAVVVCGPLEFAPGRNDTITNPVMLVEVLSPSTRYYDRGEKFLFYRNIESLQIYVVLEQDEIYVEYYQKLVDGTWQLKTFNNPDQEIEFVSIGVKITIGRLYERVELPVKPPKRSHKLPRRVTPHPTMYN